MRYLVKVYTLTDEEEAAIASAIEAGNLKDAERLSGFTQGTADAKGINALIERGLNALSVQEVAGTGTASVIGQAVRVLATKALSPLGRQVLGPRAATDFEIERPDGQQNYLLGRISGALTPGRMQQLQDADVQIIEKRDTDTYVIKANSAATLAALGFLSDVRTYGTSETLVGSPSGSVLPKALREFEAVVHADVDVDGPSTRIWPVLVRPCAPPSRLTRASRAATALASGQG